jgi:hypothetical protein
MQSADFMTHSNSSSCQQFLLVDHVLHVPPPKEVANGYEFW